MFGWVSWESIGTCTQDGPEIELECASGDWQTAGDWGQHGLPRGAVATLLGTTERRRDEYIWTEGWRENQDRDMHLHQAACTAPRVLISPYSGTHAASFSNCAQSLSDGLPDGLCPAVKAAWDLPEKSIVPIVASTESRSSSEDLASAAKISINVISTLDDNREDAKSSLRWQGQ